MPPTPSRHDLNNFELSFDKLLAYWDSASALKQEEKMGNNKRILEKNRNKREKISREWFLYIYIGSFLYLKIVIPSQEECFKSLSDINEY